MTKVEVISETTKSDKKWEQGDLLISDNGRIVMFEKTMFADCFGGTLLFSFDNDHYKKGHYSDAWFYSSFKRWYGRIIIDSVREV